MNADRASAAAGGPGGTRRVLSALVAAAACICVAGAVRAFESDPRRAAAAAAVSLLAGALSAACALGVRLAWSPWLRRMALGVTLCVLLGAAGTAAYVRWSVLPGLRQRPAGPGGLELPGADSVETRRRDELASEMEQASGNMAWVVGGSLCLAAALVLAPASGGRARPPAHE